MTCCNFLTHGSVGVPIYITVRDCNGDVVPLVDVVGLTLYLKKGTSETVERAATVHNATLGVARYTTISGDFPTPGEWKAQLLVEFPGGKEVRSLVFTIEVRPSL